MTSPQYHTDRIKTLLQKEIGWALANKVRDPRIPAIVSVTEVKLSVDGRNATVFVGIYGDDKEKKSALFALNRAAAYLQKIVAAAIKIKMKHFPKFYFKIDTSLQESEHIEHLLKEVRDDLD
ncbi:MAG: 30S ribosome-binding factor RbfA [Chitinivibrionales bacterium]|nr:30S ribosome-binding factor RbfA [Chitinivibrionales bacterium]